ncbi:signal peptidase II [bacterium]|nr:signal peptidase II [bacterium]
MLKLILGVFAFLLDQTSKYVILKKFSFGFSYPLIPGFLYITPTENRGVAFGAFSAFNSFFLSLLSFAIVVLLIYFWHHHSPFLYLIVGGAIGNISDRLRLGYVIDFINIRYWPVFNVADVCIFLGVVLTITSLLLRKGGEKSASDTD